MENFIENGFFTGMNYWGSKNAINMWSEFDAESIENDLILLKNARITHLRVFPLWPVFQPLHALYSGVAYEYTFGEDPLPDTPAGQAGVSEEACEKFEIFCKLCEKHDIKLIVALITGQMSFRIYCPPAFDGKAVLSDPTVVKWQIRFVKYFVDRFKKESSIVAWDLGNETDCMPGLDQNPDTFLVWCSNISNAIKVSDNTRPVISGTDNSNVATEKANLKTIGEVCDIHTTHPYNIFYTSFSPLCTMLSILDLPFKCKLGEDISKRPTFVQEFGSIGYMNCSYKTEADFYRASLLTSLAHGCHGTMWWCAFDQGHLTYAPYRWNTIGSDYGFFTKDNEEKPLVSENRRFCELLDKLPGKKLPAHSTNAVVLIPREEKGDLNLLRTTFALAKEANIDVSFSYLLDPIPDSPLYIIPSIKGNKSIPKNRLDELKEKVKNGSVLYICADTGLIREIPELTGVNIAWREKIDAKKTLNIGEYKLPIVTSFFYNPESTDAEIIGRDECGAGVFFKHKYGKGFIYFMTLPLESYLSSNPSIFHDLNAPAYHAVYRELARTAGIERICDSTNPYVRMTEHKIDENSAYIFAINYYHAPCETDITISTAYTVETIYGSDIKTGKIKLRENDGALYKVTKKNI